MERELKSVAVVQTGKILGILYGLMGGLMGVLMIPFMLIGAIAEPKSIIAMLPMFFMLMFYPVMGFVGGIIMAALYNLVSKWVGGLRFTVADVQAESASASGPPSL
jgi:hypothetical protein